MGRRLARQILQPLDRHTSAATDLRTFATRRNPCTKNAYSPLLAAALSLKRLPRRMYLRTCLSDRWRVWSMMARSVAPPSAADVARPERREWPEKDASLSPAPAANRLMILASW